MRSYNYKKPPLPDGSEIWIGLVVGAIIGFVLVWLGFPWWSYTTASVITFLGFSYLFQLWTEEDRQYFKGMKTVHEVNELLDTIKTFINQINKSDVRQIIANGMNDARQIIDELLKQKPTKMYGGITQLAPHVRRMLLIEEYVDIQEYPRKAGNKYQDVMAKSEQAFEGFSQEMSRMLERVNAGDIFDLTTNAELLRSLRNLLNQKSNKELMK